MNRGLLLLATISLLAISGIGYGQVAVQQFELKSEAVGVRYSIEVVTAIPYRGE